MPTTPSREVLGLLMQRDRLFAKRGPNARGKHFLEMQICVAIKAVGHRQELIVIGHSRGWPAEIQWRNLPSRILNMHQTLNLMILDRESHPSSVVYNKLLSALEVGGGNLKTLSSSPLGPGMLYKLKRPG